MYELAASLWHQLSKAEHAEWERLGTVHHMTGFAWYMSQALRPNPGIYLPLAGGTMSGTIDMDGNAITGLPAPSADVDAATKKYHDDNLPTGGYTEGCRIYHNTDYTVSNATAWVNHPFNSEEYDTDNMHDNSTNNTRITFNTAGKYLLVLQIKWDANTSGRRIIGIRKNGTDIISISEQAPPGNNTFNMTVPTIGNFSFSDYVEAILYQSSGAGLDTIYNAGANVYFMAQKIG